MSNGLSRDEGSTVVSQARCSSAQRLLGCGYQVNGSSQQMRGMIVREMRPIDAQTCEVYLLRHTKSDPDSAGTKVQAFALCYDPS